MSRDLAFYDSAAQAILILLIVVAVERRAFDRPSTRRNALIFALTFVAIAAAALDALRVLYVGRATTWDGVLVWTGIVLGLLLAAVLAAPQRWPRR